MAARGLVRLEWTLTAATAGPRYERWLRLTDEGRGAAAATAAAGDAAGAAAAGAAGRSRGPPADGGLAGARGGRAPRAGTATSLDPARPGRGRGAREAAPAARRRQAGRRGTRPEGVGPDGAAGGGARRDPGGGRRVGDATPLLLEGVTGAGKTTVYAEAIAETLIGRPAGPVLVPEIALAMPLVDRLRADLDAEIAILHSGLGEGERADEWRRIRAGGVDVVVGTRTALTAPLADVGLIVVDEEHDAAYKSDRTPRLQARDAALALARLAGAAVVLGSATPSVESVGRAREGRYRHAVLPERAQRRAAPCRGRGPARRAGRRQPRPALGRRCGPPWQSLPDGRAGDPGHQPPRHGLGGGLPRLRPRPALPGVRAHPRLPPGRRDAALPPLRHRVAAGDALPGLPLAAHPLPGRRDPASRGGGPGRLPASAGRPPGPRRGRAQGRGRASPGRLRRGSAGRPGRHEPGGQGPRRRRR